MANNIYQERIMLWVKRYGGLSNEVEEEINQLVEEYDITREIEIKKKKTSYAIGTKLLRKFKDKTYIVTVVQDGFEFNNKFYKSLSAIANEITGTRWNGKKFFGVK